MAATRRRFGIDMQAPLGNRGIDRAMDKGGELDGARTRHDQRAGPQRAEKKHGALRRSPAGTASERPSGPKPWAISHEATAPLCIQARALVRRCHSSPLRPESSGACGACSAAWAS